MANHLLAYAPRAAPGRRRGTSRAPPGSPCGGGGNSRAIERSARRWRRCADTGTIRKHLGCTAPLALPLRGGRLDGRVVSGRKYAHLALDAHALPNTLTNRTLGAGITTAIMNTSERTPASPVLGPPGATIKPWRLRRVARVDVRCGVHARTRARAQARGRARGRPRPSGGRGGSHPEVVGPNSAILQCSVGRSAGRWVGGSVVGRSVGESGNGSVGRLDGGSVGPSVGVSAPWAKPSVGRLGDP